jgi:hypothetical protein
VDLLQVDRKADSALLRGSEDERRGRQVLHRNAD